MKKLTSCPFCHSSLRDFWKDPRFDRCSSCGLVVRNPFPSDQKLKALYTSAWNQPDERSSETGSMDQLLAKQYVRELMTSLRTTNFKDQKILDFGAGKGALMMALKERQADVYGVEPYGHEALSGKMGTAFSDLDRIPKNICFDGIISMDVAEHLREPWKVFAKLHNRIKPGGWLCISTPNPKGLNAMLKGAKWRETKKPGHILFMDENTLIKMLKFAVYVDAKPVRWKVRYSNNSLRHGTQILARNLGLQGATRVIGFKPRKDA